ncbi:hypothetical protein GIB67_033601 [Kingdonia uniflora]|uniref:Uncharacterized protein n=1 Tax=Kingdonia uniflora TaxID=39325 RepID=A0A7J7LAC2_9MAGN|nr:hypothetical protein GIB67_033601 [Kingdonia uniflora]
MDDPYYVMFAIYLVSNHEAIMRVGLYFKDPYRTATFFVKAEHLSTTNIGQKKLDNPAMPERTDGGGSKGLSDSTPEISTCESVLSYSRFQHRRVYANPCWEEEKISRRCHGRCNHPGNQHGLSFDFGELEEAIVFQGVQLRNAEARKSMPLFPYSFSDVY